MVACSERAALHCFVSAVTAKSCLPENQYSPVCLSVSGHTNDPESFHKHMRSLHCFSHSNDGGV